MSYVQRDAGSRRSRRRRTRRASRRWSGAPRRRRARRRGARSARTARLRPASRSRGRPRCAGREVDRHRRDAIGDVEAQDADGARVELGDEEDARRVGERRREPAAMRVEVEGRGSVRALAHRFVVPPCEDRVAVVGRRAAERHVARRDRVGDAARALAVDEAERARRQVAKEVRRPEEHADGVGNPRRGDLVATTEVDRGALLRERGARRLLRSRRSRSSSTAAPRGSAPTPRCHLRQSRGPRRASAHACRRPARATSRRASPRRGARPRRGSGSTRRSRRRRSGREPRRRAARAAPRSSRPADRCRRGRRGRVATRRAGAPRRAPRRGANSTAYRGPSSVRHCGGTSRS